VDLTDFCLVLHIDKLPTYLVLTSSPESQPAESVDDELNKKLLSRFDVRHSATVDASRFRIGMGPLYYKAYSPLRGEDNNRLKNLEGDRSQGSGWTTRYYVLASKDLQSYQIKEIRLICLPGAKAGRSKSVHVFNCSSKCKCKQMQFTVYFPCHCWFLSNKGIILYSLLYSEILVLKYRQFGKS
jgi:hypothetical protein